MTFEEAAARLARNSRFQQLKLSLGLALGRRWVLFVIANSCLVVNLILSVMVGGLLKAESSYEIWVFLLLILGVPLTADAVSLERKWGSLDLSLVAPSADTYFYRRAALVIGALTAEAILITFLTRLFLEPFPLWPVLLQGLLVSALVGVTTLFWAVRFRTSGSALVASYLTILLLWKWVSANPVFGPSTRMDFLYSEFLWEFAKRLPVLAMATVLFFVYTRRILRNPESILL